MSVLNSTGKTVCNPEWKKTNGDGIPDLPSNAYSCSCKHCNFVLSRTADWTSTQKEKLLVDAKIGDRVLVHGETAGVVRYVGDLDSGYTNDQVYVGVKLDDPVGEHDGVYMDKRFFKCPSRHGIIVPIEAIHVLVPRDGRTIHVKAPDEQFYMSMPMLTNSAAFGTLNKTKTEKGTSMSMGSVNSSPKKPPATSKLCTCTVASQSQSDKSVCDSTRATVAMSSVKSDPTTSVDSLVVEDVNDSGDQQIESASSVTTPSKCFTRPLSKCATTPFSLFSLKSTPTKVKSCKSHECGKSFNSVKSEGASKLTVTSKRPSTVSVTANKPATNNKSAIKVFAAENEDAESDASVKPPASVVPRLAFMPESGDPSDLTAKISPKPSYTSRLLSTLPNKEPMSPLCASSQLKQVLEFEENMQAWGGGIKGWTLAQTLQKLKSAQRKGAKELNWQMSVEKLETDNMDPKVQRILTLRSEILAVRKLREDIEAEIAAEKRGANTSQLRSEIQDLEQKMLAVDKESEELAQEIKNHVLFDIIEAALMLDELTDAEGQVTTEGGPSEREESSSTEEGAEVEEDGGESCSTAEEASATDYLPADTGGEVDSPSASDDSTEAVEESKQ